MQRYAGESLGNSPRVVVLGSCKVGNFVVSTPLLRGLKERWPEATVDFIGSAVTADFESNCPWIDWRYSWDSRDASAGLDLLQRLDERHSQCGPANLAINLDGFNPVTQVLASWLRPQFVAGGTSPTTTPDIAVGDLPQQLFLEEPDRDSPAFLEAQQLAQHEFDLGIVLPPGLIETDVHAIDSARHRFSVPDILIHAPLLAQPRCGHSSTGAGWSTFAPARPQCGTRG